MGGDDAPASLMPQTPVLVAGAIGGPFCMYTVTPFRNSMSFAAQDPSLGIASVFRQVFARGPVSGWAGGVYPAIAACPQYLCLGPMYHLYNSLVGSWGALVLTGATETAVLYGAETKNGQMAINSAHEGRIPQARVQSPFNPWGPGVGIAFARNVFAMVGMRILCDPISNAIEKLAGKSTVVTLASDMTANCVSASITMPMHMLYQFVITSGPELWEKPRAEQNAACMKFLKDAYFPGGKLSSVIARDLFLRSGYIATAYTMYVNIERAAIANWPK